MPSSVIPFRKKVDGVGWRPNELAECYRVVGLLARSGLPVSIDSGLTDEGEPWAIVLREDTGDVLLHMARLDGAFVVVSAAGPVAQRGESLRAVLDTAVRTGGLAMLTRRSAAAGSEILQLHPATLIAAFIAGAWVHTETSQADLLQASARREEGGASQTEDARLSGLAATPPSAALATAAASFAAVAAALHSTQADPVLELTSEDFVQAALDLIIDVDREAPVSVVPVSMTPIEFAHLELRQDGAHILPAMMSEAAPSDNAYSFIRLEAAGTTAPVYAPSPTDILRFSIQQQNGTRSPELDWGMAGEPSLFTGLPNTADFAPMEAAEPLLAAAFSSGDEPAPPLHLAAEAPAPIRAPLVSTPPPARDGGDAAVVRPPLPLAAEEVGLHQANSVDALTLFFKNAVQILHLNGAVIQIDSGTVASPDTKGEATQSASAATQMSSFASKEADGALLSKATSAIGPAPTTESASLSLAVPGPSDVGSGSTAQPVATQPTTVAVQQLPPPPPPSNAQILMEFTTGPEHLMRVDRGGLTNPFSGRLETGDVRKVLVFDAPWLELKSFMLMPGVMMMEDDLVGGINRAGMEIRGSPVSLDLGGGLSLTLLGVVDLSLT